MVELLARRVILRLEYRTPRSSLGVAGRHEGPQNKEGSSSGAWMGLGDFKGQGEGSRLNNLMMFN